MYYVHLLAVHSTPCTVPEIRIHLNRLDDAVPAMFRFQYTGGVEEGLHWCDAGDQHHLLSGDCCPPSCTLASVDVLSSYPEFNATNVVAPPFNPPRLSERECHSSNICSIKGWPAVSRIRITDLPESIVFRDGRGAMAPNALLAYSGNP
jgi:hypothetical protein